MLWRCKSICIASMIGIEKIKMHRKLEPHQLAFLDWVLIIVGISSKLIKTEKGIRSLDHISPPLNHIQLFWVHQSCYIIHCTINQGKEKTNRNLQWTRIWKYMHAREGNHSHMSKYQDWRSRVAPRGYVQSTKGLTCRMHKHKGKWEHMIYECKGYVRCMNMWA